VRLAVPIRIVSNTPIPTPNDDLFQTEIVANLADAADDFIAENVTAGDLVITADVPLAARVVKCGALALSPRGRVFDENTVSSRLATRDLLADLRDRGVVTGGPSAYDSKDKQRFASALDRTLTRLLK
jgi:uncharacterized protein YaiI (UPF0178 family)